MPYNSSSRRSRMIFTNGRAPPSTSASATPLMAMSCGITHVSANSRSSLGESDDSRLKVKKSSVRNSSGTKGMICGCVAPSGRLRRTSPNCSFKSRRAKSMLTSRRKEISTVELPARLVDSIFWTPWTSCTASSMGIVMARCTACGEAPFQPVVTVRVGRLTSGTASIFKRGIEYTPSTTNDTKIIHVVTGKRTQNLVTRRAS